MTVGLLFFAMPLAIVGQNFASSVEDRNMRLVVEELQAVGYSATVKPQSREEVFADPRNQPFYYEKAHLLFGAHRAGRYPVSFPGTPLGDGPAAAPMIGSRRTTTSLCSNDTSVDNTPMEPVSRVCQHLLL